jgi:hypothetical protein
LFEESQELLMGIVTRLGVKFLPFSIIETAVFFAFTALYIYAPSAIYSGHWAKIAAARNDARAQAMSGAMAHARELGVSGEELAKAGQAAADAIGTEMVPSKSLPIWAWVVMGAAYLLIVTVWWKPADQRSDDIELQALAIVSALVVVGLCAYYHSQVAGLAGTFFGIFQKA